MLLFVLMCPPSSWINMTYTSRPSTTRPSPAAWSASAWLPPPTTPRPWWTTSCPQWWRYGRTTDWNSAESVWSAPRSARYATKPWPSRSYRPRRRCVGAPTVPMPLSRTTSPLTRDKWIWPIKGAIITAANSSKLKCFFLLHFWLNLSSDFFV